MEEKINLRPEPIPAIKKIQPLERDPLAEPVPSKTEGLGVTEKTERVPVAAAQPTLGAQPEQPRKKSRLTLIIFLVIAGLAVSAIALALLFAKPKLILKNAPAQAKIMLDGKEVTGASFRLSAGTHYLKVALAGYVPLNKQIQLKLFQRYQQDAQLRPIPQAQQITSQESFSLTGSSASSEQNLVYYLDNSSKIIYQLKLSNGEPIKTAITPELKQEVDQVIFSPDFKLAIFKLKSGETGLYDFKRYDLLNQEYTAWGDKIGSVIWRQDGQKVLYFQELPSGRRLITQANKDNTEQANLIILDEYGVYSNPQLDWTNDQKTALLAAEGNLYLMDIESKRISQAAQGNISSAQFSPDNQKIVYTQAGQLKLVKFERAASLSQSADDQGKFAVQEPLDLGVKADSRKTVFSPDSQQLIAYSAEDGLVNIKLADLANIQPEKFSYQDRGLLKIQSLQLSADGALLYFLTDEKKLMSLKLDKGEY